MGTLAPDRGRVKVAGFDPFRQFSALKGKLAVSFQTDRLLPWRTAVENAELGLLIQGEPKDQARTIASEWLARVNLAGAETKYTHELSGGMPSARLARPRTRRGPRTGVARQNPSASSTM